jgi:hypothetical protein
MRQKAKLAKLRPAAPALTCVPDLVGEIQRQQLLAYLDTYHDQRRSDRSVQFWRQVFSYWPVGLGLVFGFCAPYLHNLVSDPTVTTATWLPTFLFPFASVTSQHDFHMSRTMADSVSQALLYLQFPLDGLLSRVLLRQRVDVLTVCRKVTFFHIFAVLYIGLCTGSIW